jgi:hypothetical protein
VDINPSKLDSELSTGIYEHPTSESGTKRQTEVPEEPTRRQDRRINTNGKQTARRAQNGVVNLDGVLALNWSVTRVQQDGIEATHCVQDPAYVVVRYGEYTPSRMSKLVKVRHCVDRLIKTTGETSQEHNVVFLCGYQRPMHWRMTRTYVRRVRLVLFQTGNTFHEIGRVNIFVFRHRHSLQAIERVQEKNQTSETHQPLVVPPDIFPDRIEITLN